MLLIGGGSGTGKSSIAAELARQLGISWLQVDDFRLALQRSQVTLPAQTEALYYFLLGNVWQEPPKALNDALQAVGEVMAPAIEAVVENHLHQANAAILEGDGILPSLLRRPALQPLHARGDLRAVFLAEHDEAVLAANMARRGRGFGQFSAAEQRSQVRAAWLYGQWLAAEAQRYELPVVESRPWETAVERLQALLRCNL